MSHPFEGTPQYEQIYGNKHGPPIGQPGNGLGDVWGGDGGIDDGELLHPRRSRLATILRVSTETPSGDTERSREHEFDLVYQLKVYEALESLSERQRFVIELRYGFKEGVAYTQEEVAEVMGVSRQAISRLENRAIKRLRKVVEGE